MADPDPAEEEHAPVLDVYTSGGVGGRTWRISCRTCGWEIAGTDERPPEADEAVRSHRCA